MDTTELKSWDVFILPHFSGAAAQIVTQENQ